MLDFAVPEYLDSHDELLVVEMTLVSRPCVLDFAAAGICRPLVDYPDEILQQSRLEQQELFGERWPQVQNLLSAFRRHDLYLSDIKPGNILFADDDPD